MSNVIAFPRMPNAPEPRRGPDRRAFPRGGRRASDKPGHAPLVLIIDKDENSSSRCEAILARLHFAVAPARTTEEAVRVMASLRPNIVVASVADAAALRQATGADLPVVILSQDLMDPEALVEGIRQELRRTRTSA
jgi:PleD family two-component response regulator